ncbi:ATP12 family chaperone protein [Aquabacter cavernae]|uniref:ATP12 family chaperone protein n=1 Tax=Aquabacter cavernae TaxID=2496029 RepID=UPI000F8CE69C|nr:ATP12 family protein [Aquabacter cavernae]
MRDFLEDLESSLDPREAARSGQRRALPKRFYKQVGVAETEGGYGVTLDGRPLRTPARAVFAVPSVALAEAVADEWRAQETEIDPFRMPLTRLANVAIDGVAANMQDTADEVVRYAGTDLVCYRAEGPDRLVERQGAHWDPVLDWLRTEHGIRLILSAGILHVTQPEEALARFRSRVPHDPFRLAALVSLTTLMGSAVLALAVLEGRLSAEAAWAAAHVDEDWNRDQWGEDEAATARRTAREEEMRAAARLVALMA